MRFILQPPTGARGAVFGNIPVPEAGIMLRDESEARRTPIEARHYRDARALRGWSMVALDDAAQPPEGAFVFELEPETPADDTPADDATAP